MTEILLFSLLKNEWDVYLLKTNLATSNLKCREVPDRVLKFLQFFGCLRNNRGFLIGFLFLLIFQHYFNSEWINTFGQRKIWERWSTCVHSMEQKRVYNISFLLFWKSLWVERTHGPSTVTNGLMHVSWSQEHHRFSWCHWWFMLLFWFHLQPATQAPRGRPSPRRGTEENGKKEAETRGPG